jgi:hypothetical protein
MNVITGHVAAIIPRPCGMPYRRATPASPTPVHAARNAAYVTRGMSLPILRRGNLPIITLHVHIRAYAQPSPSCNVAHAPIKIKTLHNGRHRPMVDVCH